VLEGVQKYSTKNTIYSTTIDSNINYPLIDVIRKKLLLHKLEVDKMITECDSRNLCQMLL